MEAVDLVGAVARPLDERLGRAGRRRGQAVDVGGEDRVLGAAERGGGRDERRGSAREHRRAVECKWLRAQVRVPVRAEDDVGHVVRVLPDPELRVVEEVRAEVEVVAVVGAGRVARSRDGDALFGRGAGRKRARGAVELADHPAAGELVVEHDRVALVLGLAEAAEPAPERRDRNRAEQRGAALVEDLEGGVDDLDVLRLAGLAVRVGREARAGHRLVHALEGQRRRGHVRGGRRVLHDAPGARGLARDPVRERPRERLELVAGRAGPALHQPQRARGVVAEGVAHDHAAAQRAKWWWTVRQCG